MTKDMTNGNSLRHIIMFCIPMVFGNIFQQLYSMVDAIIVGKYIGLKALAAVGSTGSICFLILGFAEGICSGFSIKVAQSYGAGNYSKMRKYVANSLYLCGVVSVALTVVTLIFTRHILTLMQTPADIIDDAYSYLFITFAGITVTILYNILSCVLRALGDSRSPLIFLAIASLLNIVLDIVFIRSFGMGVGGAALATIISQAVSGVLCIIYIKKYFDILTFEKGEMNFDPQLCKKLINVGIPMALQFSITAIGSIILQTSINKLGTDYVASVTAALKIQMLVMGPMECIGITMATFCGQNKGAKKFPRIKKGLWQSIGISMIYCAFSWLLVNFAGQYIALLFVNKSDTRIISLAMHYLRVVTAFFPALGILFILRNSLQGLGYSFLPMTAGFTELIARSLVVIICVPIIGYNGVCYASPSAWLAADVLLIITTFVKLPKLKTALSE